MKIKHTILRDGSLRLSCDEETQAELRVMREESPDWGSSALEAEALERMLANCELDWLPEGSTGDLTSAPMLGISSIGDTASGYRESELPADRFGSILVGGDEGGAYYSAIVARWAWTDYAVRSFLDALAEDGHCTWQGGE